MNKNQLQKDELNSQVRHYAHLLLILLEAIKHENTSAIKEVAIASSALIRLHAFDLIRILMEGEQFKRLIKSKQVVVSPFIELILDQWLISNNKKSCITTNSSSQSIDQNFFEINKFVLNNLWVLGLSEMGAVPLLTYFLNQERFLSVKALVPLMNGRELNSNECQKVLVEHILQACRFNRYQEVSYLFPYVSKNKEKIKLLALKQALLCAGFECVDALYPESASRALHQIEFDKNLLLINACKRGSLRFLKYALMLGAEPNHQDTKALMSLVRIATLEWERVRKTQEKAGGNFDPGVPKEILEMLELLIQAGVNLRAKDDKALALAIHQCHPDLIIYILSKIYPNSSGYVEAFKVHIEKTLSENRELSNEIKGFIRNQISLKVKKFIEKLPSTSDKPMPISSEILGQDSGSELERETDTDNSTCSLPSVLTRYVDNKHLSEKKNIVRFSAIDLNAASISSEETCDSPLISRTLMSPFI